MALRGASVDGSTRWQQFWQIPCPCSKSFVIALLFRALDAIRIFGSLYVFGQRTGTNDGHLRQLQMFAGTPGDFAPGVAAAVIRLRIRPRYQYHPCSTAAKQHLIAHKQFWQSLM